MRITRNQKKRKEAEKQEQSLEDVQKSREILTKLSDINLKIKAMVEEQAQSMSVMYGNLMLAIESENEAAVGAALQTMQQYKQATDETIQDHQIFLNVGLTTLHKALEENHLNKCSVESFLRGITFCVVKLKSQPVFPNFPKDEPPVVLEGLPSDGIPFPPLSFEFTYDPGAERRAREGQEDLIRSLKEYIDSFDQPYEGDEMILEVQKKKQTNGRVYKNGYHPNGVFTSQKEGSNGLNGSYSNGVKNIVDSGAAGEVVHRFV